MAEAANRRTVMTLFSDPVSIHSHRIRLVLSEKNVTCEIEDVGPTAMPEDLLDLNPYGTVPTLVDRDLALFDTRVMCEYIDERFPHPPLLPVDPVTRANIRQYMSRIESDWYPMAEDILAGGKAATKARKELKEALTASAPIFAASPFFMSEEYTLVDATLAPLLWRLDVLGIELTGAASKQVLTYAATMFKRAGFIKSLTEGEREMRGKK